MCDLDGVQSPLNWLEDIFQQYPMQPEVGRECESLARLLIEHGDDPHEEMLAGKGILYEFLCSWFDPSYGELVEDYIASPDIIYFLLERGVDVSWCLPLTLELFTRYPAFYDKLSERASAAPL